MQQSYGNNSKAKVIGAVLTIVVIAGIVLITDHLKASKTVATTSTAATTTATPSDSSTTTSQSTSTDTSSNASTASTDTSCYKDGTYSATSDYYVPHGEESITVKLTIANGIVTNSSISNSEGDHDSARYQEDFASVYKSYVVGKNISGLSLSRLAGASDTTQGFNDAVSQIANQAKA